MISLAPASGMNIGTGAADGIVKVLRKATDQSSQQRLLRQAVRMTDLNDERLNSTVGKMSRKDKQVMMKAISSLSRVVNAVQLGHQ